MTKGTITVLDDLLSDPLVQLVMARDSVRPEELRHMLERDRVRAADPRMVPPAHVISACAARSLCC
ncbi:MAG: hypothetical protein NTV73_14490 [Hyphomicrobiales bacterium]|nr:hypothetical protein [Hyphomicrobiales bacterium]